MLQWTYIWKNSLVVPYNPPLRPFISSSGFFPSTETRSATNTRRKRERRGKQGRDRDSQRETEKSEWQGKAPRRKPKFLHHQINLQPPVSQFPKKCFPQQLACALTHTHTHTPDVLYFLLRREKERKRHKKADPLWVDVKDDGGLPVS